MKRFAVLGSPIGHSRSPAMHNAAFRVLGIDSYRYEAIETRPDELPARLEDVRRGVLEGVNLTVPLKQHAVPLCREVSPMARRVGAVNTVARREDGALVGHNTDARGLLMGLRASGIAMNPGERVLLLGGGGAARAMAAGLLDAGLELVWVSRRPHGLPSWEHTLACGWDEVLDPPAGGFGAVVNATTVGMEGGPAAFPVPVDAARLEAWGARAVVDAVYPARPGGLVAHAQAAGLPAIDGLPMLWGQGVLALETWLGQTLSNPVRRAMATAIGVRNLDLAYM